MSNTVLRHCVLGTIVLLVAACAIPKHLTTGQVAPDMVISKERRIVILDITDGQEKDQEATKGSGQAMVNALRDRIMSHGIPVNVIQTTELEKGYQEAERLGFNYVLRSVFTNWEDNATAWSGNPDRASLALELYSVEQKRLAASASHERQASGATLMSSTPMRFIPELADRTLGRILGWSDSTQ